MRTFSRIAQRVSLTLLFLSITLGDCNADFVVTYTGQSFGFAESPFTTADLITGTATFASVGDVTPLQISLTSSVGGSAGFSITDNSGTAGTFAWSGSSISAWEVAIQDDVFGASNSEVLTISNVLSDQATIDLGGATSNALSFAPGSWSPAAVAVPEPNSFLLFAFSGICFVLRRKFMPRKLIHK